MVHAALVMCNGDPVESVPLPWWRQAFQQQYLDLYLHRDLAEAARAVKFLESALDLRSNHRLLDLCCGPGRHLTFLKDRVRQAVGFDLSRVLLMRARLHGRAVHTSESSQMGVPPLLIQGDMRHLPLADAQFDRVVNLFTSFGYFSSDGENEQVLAEVARVLRFGSKGVGGLFALDHINRQSLLHNFQALTRRLLPGGMEVIEERRWDEEERRVEKDIACVGADGLVDRWRESVRVFEPEELDQMLRRAGLEPLRRYGDYDGRGWTPQAPRLIVIARR